MQGRAILVAPAVAAHAIANVRVVIKVITLPQLVIMQVTVIKVLPQLQLDHEQEVAIKDTVQLLLVTTQPTIVKHQIQLLLVVEQDVTIKGSMLWPSVTMLVMVRAGLHVVQNADNKITLLPLVTKLATTIRISAVLQSTQQLVY